MRIELRREAGSIPRFRRHPVFDITQTDMKQDGPATVCQHGDQITSPFREVGATYLPLAGMIGRTTCDAC